MLFPVETPVPSIRLVVGELREAVQGEIFGMEMEMYAVMDRKLRQYGQIVLARSLPAVSRELAVAVIGSGDMMEKYPDDFDLWYLGKFDSDTGVITPAEVPILQVSVSTILEEHKHGS